MSERQPFELRTPQDRTLHGFLDFPPANHPPPWPVVVVCHGFKGFMEWGFFPPLAELLADRGFLAVRFNFHGAGTLPGEDRVSDEGAFRDDTYSRELEDAAAVLRSLGEIAGERADTGRVGLFGHSRGGAVALLAAAHPELAGVPVRALVTWAAIAQADRWSGEEKQQWRRDGSLPVVNSRTGQVLALGLDLLRDVEEHRDALDLAAAARRRRAPWLIVHGSDDTSVPFEEGEGLAAAASEPKELLAVEGGDHTFGAKQPWAGPTPQLIAAMNATQSWFRRHLR